MQLIGVLVYPFMPDSGVGRVAFEAFGALVLMLAVLSVRDSRTPTWVAIVLAVVASSLSIVEAFQPSVTLEVLSFAVHAVFYFAAAASLMVYMLEDRQVTGDELFAVGATFTLVAWGFAYVYQVVQALQPGSFIAAINPEQARTWFELLFLSFTTLSSTGLGDVLPVSDHARSVVMIEQLAGLAYVALVVSRLVGLTLGRRAADEPGLELENTPGTDIKG